MASSRLTEDRRYVIVTTGDTHSRVGDVLMVLDDAATKGIDPATWMLRVCAPPPTSSHMNGSSPAAARTGRGGVRERDRARGMIKVPAFNFAKTLENVDLSAMTGVRVAESLQTLDISTMFKINLRDLPARVTADLASQFDRTAQEAVALAEVDELAAGVEDAVGVQLKNMTPAKRRELALEVVALIAGFLLLAAWLTQKDPKNPAEGVGRFLTCAAAYIYVYWRLIGKL